MTGASDLVWPVEMLRSWPPESMPKSGAVQFVGGMLDGQIRQLPTTVDDGPLPCNGYDHGRPVRHVYRLTRWRLDPVTFLGN